MDDVVRNKVASIERCLRRVREEFRDDPRRLDDQTIQDALALNLQRACETSIDLAMQVTPARAADATRPAARGPAGSR